MYQRGFDRWRRQLLSYAQGQVLEISPGEGNNFRFYPLKVKLTVADMSTKIIDKAKVKAMEYGVNASFIKGSVDQLEFGPGSFDTIVSTFSLCAYEDPVMVLSRFNTWCRPGGSILLMEHGLSRYAFVRWVQQKWESHHFRRTGCHLDMDIKAIVESSQPRIQRIERKMGGIIYLVWASPGLK
jgi:ubiquinone/menaquinone biosynthesis C-methylase UbiE